MGKELDADTELMLEVRDGDDEAFATLVRRYQSRVVGLAYRYIGDRESAEDLAQEAFLRVYKARERYEPRAKFSTWLYRIVVNLCLNEIRWRKGRPAMALAVATETSSNLNVDVTDNEPEPIQTMQDAELAETIREIIGTLPENQRIAILLNKYEGLSYIEVAESMELSVMAVKSLLTRARVKIKEKLAPFLREESRDAV
ncbi:MAG: sigma-70 family RNA polymerase sigma factor [Planctomycetota bacterium]